MMFVKELTASNPIHVTRMTNETHFENWRKARAAAFERSHSAFLCVITADLVHTKPTATTSKSRDTLNERTLLISPAIENFVAYSEATNDRSNRPAYMAITAPPLNGILRMGSAPHLG